MRKLMLAICLGLLVISPVHARPPSSDNPVVIVKGWYRHFLQREADPGGLNGWVTALRNGEEPAYLLARFVAGDEYYTKAGGSDKDWLVALFQDLSGRKPTSQDLRHYMSRLDRETHLDVAYDLVRRYGGS